MVRSQGGKKPTGGGPFDRSSLTRWRQRMGEEKLAALIQESLNLAKRTGAAKLAAPRMRGRSRWRAGRRSISAAERSRSPAARSLSAALSKTMAAPPALGASNETVGVFMQQNSVIDGRGRSRSRALRRSTASPCKPATGRRFRKG